MQLLLMVCVEHFHDFQANLLSILSEITGDSAKIRSSESSIDEEFDNIDDDNESVSSGSEVSSDSLDQDSDQKIGLI